MNIDVALTDEPASDAREAILNHLVRFNVERAGPYDWRPLAVLITDRGTAETIGGLWGRTCWKWLCVELLFIPENCRGSALRSCGRLKRRRSAAGVSVHGSTPSATKLQVSTNGLVTPCSVL